MHVQVLGHGSRAVARARDRARGTGAPVHPPPTTTPADLPPPQSQAEAAADAGGRGANEHGCICNYYSCRTFHEIDATAAGSLSRAVSARPWFQQENLDILQVLVHRFHYLGTNLQKNRIQGKLHL